MPFTTFGRSDTGRQRAANEDHFVCLALDDLSGDEHVVAVADGMGGHAGGKVASGIAIEVLRSQLSTPDGAAARPSSGALLRNVFESANREILARAAEDVGLTDMGTTMVVALAHGGGATLANLGDSRAYMIRGTIIGQVTVDHSWREEARQHDLPLDEIEMSPFRETITRSLGVDQAVKVDLYDIELEPGDQLLLCSDGVHDLLSDLDILAAVLDEKAPEEISRRLIDEANEAGGHDNSTCVLLRYDAPASQPVTADSPTGAAER